MLGCGRMGAVAWTTLAGALGATLLVARVAAAAPDDDPKARARSHYDTGTGAYLRADYAVAAAEFSEADRLMPSPAALDAALDAALRADDAPLGMELAQRSSRAPAEGRIASLVLQARARFAKRTGRVKVSCAPVACAARVDGVAVEPGTERYVRVGAHVVRVARGGRTEERTVDVEPKALHEIRFDDGARAADAPETTHAPRDLDAPSPPTPPLSSSPPAGLSPAWVAGGAAVTALFGFAAAVSAFDTRGKHDDYYRGGCDRLAAAGCSKTADEGMAAQHRTNVLFAVTGALAVTTAAVAIFAVRWRDRPGTLTVGASGGQVGAFLGVPLE